MAKEINKDLETVKKLLYDKCGFKLTNLIQHSESLEYGACSFILNDMKIQQRISKITPTKTGQFVTIWKRNNNGITEPYDIIDDLDFIIIISKSDHNFGQFVFPKSILGQNGIITQNGKVGKRGIRVYPPWVICTNKQAMLTQSWQTKYFITISKEKEIDMDEVIELFK
jgi:hypothetical protein